MINSGNTARVEVQADPGDAVVINSGSIGPAVSGLTIEFDSGPGTLTNVVRGRVIGGIELFGASDTVNFVGGNWLFTFTTLTAVLTGTPEATPLQPQRSIPAAPRLSSR